MWTWDPLFLLGLAPALVGIPFGLFVLSARPTLQNRALGAFLVLFSLAELFSGARFLMSEPHDAYAAWIVRQSTLGVLVALLLVFYSTLPTPFARPLRPTAVRAALLVAALALSLATLRDPSLASSGVQRDAADSVWIAIGDGPLWAPPVVALLLIVVLGAPFSRSALRRANAEEERRKLRSLARAFTFYALVQGGALTALLLPRLLLNEEGSPILVAVNFAVVPIANLLFIALLGYGILRAQLFGIELRLKWTLRRGTVAAAFVGVFFVVSEGAQQAFSAGLGPVAGLVAAGLLVFALAPLQHAADRLADAAMPRVNDTPEYRGARSREIYRAALESAARDGHVTDKERDMLATLQEQLGIAPTEALALEREAMREFSA